MTTTDATETVASLGGLSSDAARARLAQLGPNLTAGVSTNPVLDALGKFWAPIPCMLEMVIAVELFLHNRVEAAVIAVLLVFNATLGFFRENRSKATLSALRSRLALVASVHRDNTWVQLPAADLVPDDLVKLSLGGIVPADATIISGSVLLDQSMLTGESIPVEAGEKALAYAGSLIRRGEAAALVTATGERTKFGRTAELVRTAKAESTQQKVVFRVVRNLAFYNLAVIAFLITYGLAHGEAAAALVPMVLTAILMSIPVALPATFTLAAAIGAESLAKDGVLPTRLSAVDEAATMDVLCADKTGTLTQNTLTVAEVLPFAGFDRKLVLTLASLASSDGGQDPVDQAVRKSAQENDPPVGYKLAAFRPFDPATKMSSADATDPVGKPMTIIKGALEVVAAMANPDADARKAGTSLEGDGHRVLGVVVVRGGVKSLAGIIALSDPPRADSAGLVTQLHELGIRVIMITGDSFATAANVAKLVGLDGPVCPAGDLPPGASAEKFAVFSGILPEGKFQVVKMLQAAGHTVGMCGDGANDAPALRQAQMGIAVSTATDVAKSAAGIVLTTQGLGGIVASVREGRVCFERILTYTLRSVTHKFVGTLFLACGLLMTGQAILTPLLLVISMIPGDFIAMFTTTDNVSISAGPSVWRIGGITLTGAILGLVTLAFCTSVLAVGHYGLKLDILHLRTLAIATLVFSGQSILYVVRERHHFWNSRPSNWLMFSSVIDLLLISILSTRGIWMTALPLGTLACLAIATALFTFVLDAVKVPVVRRLQIA
jgi:H+-transporting ATPase